MHARFHSWCQKTSRLLNVVIVTVLVVLLVLLMLIILGYIFNWSWTGLHGRTLYDWLQLLIIPTVLAVGGYLFNYTTSRNEQKATQLRAQTELEAAAKRDQTERDISLDNQREAALQAYIDTMSELLLHEQLRQSAEDDEVRKIARVRTLTVLPRLDKDRKARVIQFLYESGLIQKDKCIVDLSGANLHEVNLYKANLDKANLRDVSLLRASLRYANLSKADLFGADLFGADLYRANLYSANLGKAYLPRADLGASDLSYVNLSEADLHEANLDYANLLGANLLGARVTTEQLDKARLLELATMPDGTKKA